jgi:hypothetical protein
MYVRHINYLYTNYMIIYNTIIRATFFLHPVQLRSNVSVCVSLRESTTPTVAVLQSDQRRRALCNIGPAGPALATDCALQSGHKLLTDNVRSAVLSPALTMDCAL